MLHVLALLTIHRRAYKYVCKTSMHVCKVNIINLRARKYVLFDVHTHLRFE